MVCPVLVYGRHKVLPKVHFEGSSAPLPSPEVMSKRNKKQATAEAMTAGPEKQVPQSSENTSLSRSSVSDKQKGLAHVEELPSSGRDLLANNSDSDNLLAMEDGRCTENARVHQDMSHWSVGPEDKVKKKNCCSVQGLVSRVCENVVQCQ